MYMYLHRSTVISKQLYSSIFAVLVKGNNTVHVEIYVVTWLKGISRAVQEFVVAVLNQVPS